MLARTAANLYWMSRYLERAENLARVLEVNQGLAWLKAARPGEDMAAPLRLTDSEAAFAAQHGAELTPAALWAFLGFSAHPARIRSCLARARDNADAARDALTGEMWQAIHATWLGMQAAIDAPPADPANFADWVKERSQLFRGITYGAIHRNDAYRFIRLGTFIERADNTARLLKLRYRGHRAGMADHYGLMALLESVSAQDAYLAVYHDTVSAPKVAELLLLNPDAPRSLAACFAEIRQILPQIGGPRGRAAKKRATELAAALEYGELQDILAHGLQNYLGEFLDQLTQLNDELHAAYMEAA